MENQSLWIYNETHPIYAEMAEKAYQKGQDEYMKLCLLQGEPWECGAYEQLEKVKQECIAAVCFSAMAMESYTNLFSLIYLSVEFAEHIDRLDVPAKLSVAMYTAFKKKLNKGEAPLQNIIETVRARNGFVHSKPKLMKDPKETCQFPALNIEKRYLEPAYKSVKALQEVSEWIGKNLGEEYIPFHQKEISPDYREMQCPFVFAEKMALY